ncbi:universal stress protein [Nitrosopumilus sp. S4]
MTVQQIKNILVPLDGSDSSKKGLDKAIFIAKLTNATIIGINIVVIYPTLVSTVTNYRKFVTSKAEKMLELSKKYCQKQEVKFVSKILHGKPSTKISEFAQKEKIDLIVMGSKGIGGFKGTIMGSVSNAVVQKSKVSVLVVK